MKIQLSISLLASNRAASLERCLDSLRPLLMQVPSELIVVFTGTDERVREIASRYTDIILPFTWCDNFSAARNVGLWAAKGEWFMYIDDDEWFEDVAEIRDFFLSGEYQSYGSACYKQKNYKNWDGIEYSDYHAFRMARVVPGLAFQNTVHEELVPRVMPCKYFHTYVNHYGYIFGPGSENADKTSRNLPLLLQNIQERPAYVKNYLQVVQEYIIVKEWEKAEDYCRKGLRLCRDYEDDFYQGWLQVNLLTVLCSKKDFEKAEQEALRILKKEHPRELIRLDIYETLLAIYTRRGASEKILSYGVKFEETLAYMDQKPELWRKQTYADITEDRIKTPDRLYQIRINCTESALKQDNIEQAVYFLKLLPWEEEAWMQRYYPVFDKWKQSYEEAYRTLLEHFPEHSPYWMLQAAVEHDREPQEAYRLELFVRCMEKTESFYLRQQAVKAAILCDVDLAAIVSVMDLDAWKECANALIGEKISHEEYVRLEVSTEKLIQCAPIYGLWLKKRLLERKLIRGYLTGEVMIRTLREYSGYVLQFYRIQYREEMFSEETRILLPKDCRFALFVWEGVEKMEHAEFPEAVRLFRKALRFYPEMTGVIREVIRQISIKAETPVQNSGEEFQMLAQQMKDTLHTMLDKRQYAQALQIILQMSALLPEDMELLRMRQNVLREMAE